MHRKSIAYSILVHMLYNKYSNLQRIQLNALMRTDAY